MTIRRGASGNDVRKIQSRLSELTLYRGTIDGSFGGGTEGAVKVFQRNSGLDQSGAVAMPAHGRSCSSGNSPGNRIWSVSRWLFDVSR